MLTAVSFPQSPANSESSIAYKKLFIITEATNPYKYIQYTHSLLGYSKEGFTEDNVDFGQFTVF